MLIVLNSKKAQNEGYNRLQSQLKHQATLSLSTLLKHLIHMNLYENNMLYVNKDKN